MENNTVENMITDITKQFHNTSLFDLSAHLLNYYYHHFYQGTEHDSVTLMYFDHLNINLVIWLGQNAQYLKKDKKSIKKLSNFFTKEIIKGKINTHHARVRIYHKWLGKDKYINDTDLVLQYMFKLHPSFTDSKEVRKDLGLLESVNDLKKKLKELK